MGNETTPGPISVRCDMCGQLHLATYSHIGQWSNKPVWSAVCGMWTEYYTSEAAEAVTVARDVERHSHNTRLDQQHDGVQGLWTGYRTVCGCGWVSGWVKSVREAEAFGQEHQRNSGSGRCSDWWCEVPE